MVPSGWLSTLFWTTLGGNFELFTQQYVNPSKNLYLSSIYSLLKPCLSSLALQNVFECELALPGTDYRFTKPTIYSPGQIIISLSLPSLSPSSTNSQYHQYQLLLHKSNKLFTRSLSLSLSLPLWFHCFGHYPLQPKDNVINIKDCFNNPTIYSPGDISTFTFTVFANAIFNEDSSCSPQSPS